MSIDEKKATALRKPFPKESIGKLPKGGAMLDYVGHAAVTDRLLTVDPEWSWEPFALDDHGLPALDRSGNLWIKLTVCGVTRIGVGDGKSAKECIGDAIRNAAMRFGVALDLWAKENLVEFAQAAASHQAAPRAPKEPQPEFPPAEKVTPEERDATLTNLEQAIKEPPSRESALLNTRGQLAKAMYAGINEAGIEEAERIDWLCHVIGRDITSTKQMTDDEARAVLRVLDDRKKAKA